MSGEGKAAEKAKLRDPFSSNRYSSRPRKGRFGLENRPTSLVVSLVGLGMASCNPWARSVREFSELDPYFSARFPHEILVQEVRYTGGLRLLRRVPALVALARARRHGGSLDG